MSDEMEIPGHKVRVVTLGNSALVNASDSGLRVPQLYETDEVRIESGPDFKMVNLADGTKTAVPERFLVYLEHNGSWEVENND